MELFLESMANTEQTVNQEVKPSDIKLCDIFCVPIRCTVGKANQILAAAIKM
jgi:hypothetical protein